VSVGFAGLSIFLLLAVTLVVVAAVVLGIVWIVLDRRKKRD
jgi:hypothetical protein